MPHVLFPTHVAVRELDLSKIESLDSDPEHRPKAELNYTPIPDDDFLERLTVAFNKHRSAPSMMLELNCDRIRFIGGLPRGFAAFAAPPKPGRNTDRYIFGHHENENAGFKYDKPFRSLTSFVPHVFWIIVDQIVQGNFPRGCLCDVCAVDNRKERKDL
ncbi:hypothetical protein KCU85_g8708, partial [Aureobasidium melanogenum]